MNLSSATQFGQTFGVTSVTQNGYTTGQISGVSVSASGIVQANYTNGQSKNLGQVAVATFANQQGLQQVQNTNWVQTFASGQPVFGQAGGADFGTIQSGSLEASNVDITAQLVNMITAQRAFQANAEMISTDNSITQTVINIPNQQLRHQEPLTHGSSRLCSDVGAQREILRAQAANNHNLANANTNGFKADLSAFQTKSVTGAGLASRAYATDDQLQAGMQVQDRSTRPVATWMLPSRGRAGLRCRRK